jgi:hypothetical protein
METIAIFIVRIFIRRVSRGLKRVVALAEAIADVTLRVSGIHKSHLSEKREVILP